MISHNYKVIDNKGFQNWIKKNSVNLVKYVVNAFYLISFQRDHGLMTSLFSEKTESSVRTMEMKANHLAEKAIRRLVSSSPVFPSYPLSVLDSIIMEMPSQLHPGIEYESTLLGRFIKRFCEDGVRNVGTRIALLKYFYGYENDHIYLLLNEEKTTIDKAYYRWKRDCIMKKKFQISEFQKADILQILEEIEGLSSNELNRKVDKLFKFYSECSAFYSVDCFDNSISEDIRLKRCKKRYDNKVDYEYRTWCLTFNRGCIRNVRRLIETKKVEFGGLPLPHPPDEIKLSQTLREWIC